MEGPPCGVAGVDALRERKGVQLAEGVLRRRTFT